MTSTDIVIQDDLAPSSQPSTLNVMTTEQLRYIANTEFVPRGLRGNLPAILACVATGRAIGVDDMTAIRSIHIIDGKPTFSAELMVMLVRRRGHSITGDVGDGVATVTGTRADNGDVMTSTWTMAMAQRAGLAGKGNWKSYPEAMLWARAVSQLCRMLFADCFAGGTYTPEELGDDGELTEPGGLAPPKEVEVIPVPEPSPGSVSAPVDDGKFPPPDEVIPESATRDQKRKLNVLVGKLRPAHVTTEQLWRGCGLSPDLGRLEDGEVHWSPLRDGLTKAQASSLIERLSKLEEVVSAQEQAVDAAAESSFRVPEGAV